MTSLIDSDGVANTIQTQRFELDTLAETADERGDAVLGALYDYAEMIALQSD